MGLFRRRRTAQVESNSAPASSTLSGETQRRVLPNPPTVNRHGARSVDAQVDYLLQLITPLPAFGMYLLDAWGSALCEDITADLTIPVEDLAACEGYAVRCDDLIGLPEAGSITLKVVEHTVLPQTAVKVLAAQPLPQGADAVISLTDLRRDGASVTISTAVKLGDNVRWAGSEVRPSMPLMRAGERLDARDSALMALAGIDRVLARPRPRVVTMALGADDSLNGVNSHMLAALAKSDRTQVWRVPFAGGDERQLRDLISDQLIRADLLIATAPIGEDSSVMKVISSMAVIDVATVAMRPGGTVVFALVGEDEIPMLIVPEDSVSAYVSYQLFARPLINQLMGAEQVKPLKQSCLLGDDLLSEEGVMDLRFATVREQSGEKVAVPLSSGHGIKLADLVRAHALLVLDESTTQLGLGERVDCWMLRD